MTLEQLLDKDKNLLGTAKERYTLAHRLAEAVLKYHDGPWLPLNLNKRNVHFYLHEDGTVDIGNPFFIAQLPTTGTLDYDWIKETRACHTILIHLGILIMEIITIRAIESFPFGKDLKDPGPSGDPSELQRVAREFLHKRFRSSRHSVVENAVWQCIHPTLGDHGISGALEQETRCSHLCLTPSRKRQNGRPG